MKLVNTVKIIAAKTVNAATGDVSHACGGANCAHGITNVSATDDELDSCALHPHSESAR